MGEWKTVRFGELAAPEARSFSVGPFGSAITKENYVPSGVPVVRGVNLARGRFFDDDFVFVSDQKADELAYANLKPADLVFTHRGNLGQVSMIPRRPRFARYILSSSQVKARLDVSRALPEFYYYWFRSSFGQESLLSNASTVGVPGIASPLATIKSLAVPLPPHGEQQAIAAVLGALDDKIAVNEQIADCSHRLALLRYSEATVGYKSVPLSSLVDPILGGTPDRKVSEYWGPGVPWASAKDVAACQYGTLITTAEEITAVAVTGSKRFRPVPKGAVLLTARGTVGAVARVCQETSLNQSCYAMLPRTVPSAVLYLTVLSAVDQMLNVAHGSVFSTLNMKSFDHLQAPALSSSELDRLESIVAPLLEQVELRLRENQSLAQLRDTLLPKLMSGQIRVRDAERMVEDAT